MERDRQKAAKKAARAKAKAEKAELKKAGAAGILPEGDELAGAAPTEATIEASLEASAEGKPAEN